jgi:hypothetical protein
VRISALPEVALEERRAQEAVGEGPNLGLIERAKQAHRLDCSQALVELALLVALAMIRIVDLHHLHRCRDRQRDLRTREPVESLRFMSRTQYCTP